MRIATFNILHGRSVEDDRVDVDRFAAAVQALDADVLALQEVDHLQERSAHTDLTAVAAEAMGATHHRFVAALSGTPGATWMAATGTEHPDSAAYGIALLSRLPVRSWQVVRLPALPTRVPMWFREQRRAGVVHDEPRVAMAAVVDDGGAGLTVVNTHLTFLPGWNRLQLRRLMRGFSTAAPLVLVGDLNMAPRAAAAVTGLRPLATHATFPVDEPRVQLDHVLARGDVARPYRTAAPRLPLSDHRALTVDLPDLTASPADNEQPG